VSKRTRGSRRAQQRRAGRHGARPGRPTHRRSDSAGRTYRPSELAVAPEIAEELVEEDVDDAPAQEVAARAVRAAAPRGRARPSSLLAAKAATEYVYVAQDVRRIVLVAGLLFGIMFALWILIVVTKVIPL
jgi:hypothetical protein